MINMIFYLLVRLLLMAVSLALQLAMAAAQLLTTCLVFGLRAAWRGYRRHQIARRAQASQATTPLAPHASTPIRQSSDAPGYTPRTLQPRPLRPRPRR